MDLLKELTKNKFVLVLLEEKQYFEELVKIVKRVNKEHEKICYVCLSKTCNDVLDELKRINLNTNKFYFIDVLSSHYETPEPIKNCIFLKSPIDLSAIRVAVTKSVNKKNCSVVIFDTISALLVYQEVFNIVKLTHSLVTEKLHEKSNTVFIVLKNQDEVLKDLNAGLIKDLSMFADKTINFSKAQD